MCQQIYSWLLGGRHAEEEYCGQVGGVGGGVRSGSHCLTGPEIVTGTKVGTRNIMEPGPALVLNLDQIQMISGTETGTGTRTSTGT